MYRRGQRPRLSHPHWHQQQSCTQINQRNTSTYTLNKFRVHRTLRPCMLWEQDPRWRCLWEQRKAARSKSRDFPLPRHATLRYKPRLEIALHVTKLAVNLLVAWLSTTDETRPGNKNRAPRGVHMLANEESRERHNISFMRHLSAADRTDTDHVHLAVCVTACTFVISFLIVSRTRPSG
jgi:hypothetical protein